MTPRMRSVRKGRQACCHVTAGSQGGSDVTVEPVDERGYGGVSACSRVPGVVDLDMPGGHLEVADDWGGYGGTAVRRVRR